MQLKTAARRMNRNFFVFCSVPSDTLDMKSQNVLGCDGRKLYVSEMVLKIAEDEFIIPQRIFFSHSAAGNCKNARYLLKFS